MTNKEKDLLLKDLCARLPYMVKCAGWLNINNDEDVAKVYPWIDGEYIDGITDNKIRIQGTWVKIEFVKPYLRPMESMTEEEKEYIKNRWCYEDWYDICDFLNHYQIDAGDTYAFIDWLNANHFDYRGLISMGLALPAPEGMYNNKN